VNLFGVCVTAFIAVIVLLTVLAGVIHLITRLFPDIRRGVGAPMVAAIEGAVTAIYPGARVTRIEKESNES
jgi:hypothetical protein